MLLSPKFVNLVFFISQKVIFSFSFFLILGSILMAFGFSGVFVHYKNLIFLLISLEVVLLGINTVIIPASVFFDDLAGYILSVFTLSVAGSEASVGLALAIIIYRVTRKAKLPAILDKLKF